MNFKPDLHIQDMAIFQDPAKKFFVSQFFPNGRGHKKLSKKIGDMPRPNSFSEHLGRVLTKGPKKRMKQRKR